MKVDSQLRQEFTRIVSDLTSHLNRFAGKTILLTGGSGFLGNLYKLFFLYCNNNQYIFPSCKVISIDNYIKGHTTLNDEIKHDCLLSINHDLTTPLGWKLDGDVDFIINCAGNASPQNYLTYPYETMQISTIGTDLLLQLALNKNAKILNFSSSEVLGTPPDNEIPTSEESIARINSMDKRSPYDVTKLYIETISKVYKDKKGLDCKVIRPFNIIGRVHKNDYRVIPNYLSKILNNEKIQVYKPGTQTRTFCYYSDFITGSLLVLLNGKDLLYHIGNPYNEISMYDLALKIQKIAGKEDLVSLVDTPEVYKLEPKRRCPSIKKAQDELGYNPKIDLDTMLFRIHDWAIENYK